MTRHDRPKNFKVRVTEEVPVAPLDEQFSHPYKGTTFAHHIAIGDLYVREDQPVEWSDPFPCRPDEGYSDNQSLLETLRETLAVALDSIDERIAHQDRLSKKSKDGRAFRDAVAAGDPDAMHKVMADTEYDPSEDSFDLLCGKKGVLLDLPAEDVGAVVAALVEYGVDLDTSWTRGVCTLSESSYGMPILFRAVFRSNAPLVQALLENGADANIAFVDEHDDETAVSAMQVVFDKMRSLVLSEAESIRHVLLDGYGESESDVLLNEIVPLLWEEVDLAKEVEYSLRPYFMDVDSAQSTWSAIGVTLEIEED